MLADQLRNDGFAVLPSCLGESTLAALSGKFGDDCHPQRNILDLDIVRELAISKPVRQVMEAIREAQERFQLYPASLKNIGELNRWDNTASAFWAK